MVSFVEPMFFGNLLATGVGAAFLVTLTLLAGSTFADSRRSRRQVREHLVRKATSRGEQVAALASSSSPIRDNTRAEAISAAARPVVSALPPVKAARPAFGPLRDPLFAGKLEGIAGLYLSPPEFALVLCCGEPGQAQAVNRTRPGFGQGNKAAIVDHKGLLDAASLSDALSTLCGSVVGGLQPHHRHTAWLMFLRDVDRQTPPGKQLHVICDNKATHGYPSVMEWLAAHPRFHVHFAPRSGSGVSMIQQIFDDVITEQFGAGAFHNVPELVAAISRHVEARVAEPMPFVWATSSNERPRTAVAPTVNRRRFKRLQLRQIAAQPLGLDPSLIGEMFAEARA